MTKNFPELMTDLRSTMSLKPNVKINSCLDTSEGNCRTARQDLKAIKGRRQEAIHLVRLRGDVCLMSGNGPRRPVRELQVA